MLFPRYSWATVMDVWFNETNPDPSELCTKLQSGIAYDADHSNCTSRLSGDDKDVTDHAAIGTPFPRKNQSTCWQKYKL